MWQCMGWLDAWTGDPSTHLGQRLQRLCGNGCRTTTQYDIGEVSNHRVGGVAANPTNFDRDETSCGAKLIASASNFKTP